MFISQVYNFHCCPSLSDNHSLLTRRHWLTLTWICSLLKIVHHSISWFTCFISAALTSLRSHVLINVMGGESLEFAFKVLPVFFQWETHFCVVFSVHASCFPPCVFPRALFWCVQNAGLKSSLKFTSLEKKESGSCWCFLPSSHFQRVTSFSCWNLSLCVVLPSA